jgi:hypothetical protein
MTLTPGTLVWWQPTGATRPRPARVVSITGQRYVVQVLDAYGNPHPLWWPKDAEAGDLRPQVRDAA